MSTKLHSEKIDENLSRSEDGKVRCTFNIDNPTFRHYHDTEFGRPKKDDTLIFEKICIEGFAAGLSLLTVLTKREDYREAFDNFEIDKVAAYDGNRVRSLMANDKIIQNKSKIESVINNAKRAQALIEEYGSLAAFLWHFEPDPSERPSEMTMDYLSKHGRSEQSERMAKVLKSKGWTYVGPTTLYAVMQAMGVVNDHFEGCEFRKPCLEERKSFSIPKRN